MTLDEQILACARDNGYKGDSTKPVRKDMTTSDKEGEWRFYFRTKAGALYCWVLSDKQFKQWQRDYKLNNLLFQ